MIVAPFNHAVPVVVWPSKSRKMRLVAPGLLCSKNAPSAVEVAVTVAEPPTYPVLVVVIVAVEVVKEATPVTVTKPVPLIATVPDAVAVPAHV